MREDKLEFIRMFINYRDYALEEEPHTIIGPQISHIIDELLHGYFQERYYLAPIRKPSKYFNFSALLDYLNNHVLLYISEENEGLLELDFQNHFTFKNYGHEDLY